MINLDANAHWRAIPEVLAFLEKLDFERIGNPNSVHAGGQYSRALIEEARSCIAQALGLSLDDRIIFTSGATEANNLAICSSLPLEPENPITAIATSIEHPSVLETLGAMRRRGVEVIHIGPRSRFESCREDFVSACDNSTRLASVMLANNETGQIIPVPELFAALKRDYPHVTLHCDAAQALGKIPFNFSALGADLVTISGHKIGAPSGVGALIARTSGALRPLLYGGPQESHQRAGTENVVGIACFGVAVSVAVRDLEQRAKKMRSYRNRLRDDLLTRVPRAECILDESIDALPNTLSVRFRGIPSDDLVVALDLEGIWVSSGAACASGKPQPSHVLLAMGLDSQAARETVRFSFEGTPIANMETVVETIVRVIESLEKVHGHPRS